MTRIREVGPEARALISGKDVDPIRAEGPQAPVQVPMAFQVRPRVNLEKIPHTDTHLRIEEGADFIAPADRLGKFIERGRRMLNIRGEIANLTTEYEELKKEMISDATEYPGLVGANFPDRSILVTDVYNRVVVDMDNFKKRAGGDFDAIGVDEVTVKVRVRQGRKANAVVDLFNTAILEAEVEGEVSREIKVKDWDMASEKIRSGQIPLDSVDSSSEKRVIPHSKLNALSDF